MTLSKRSKLCLFGALLAPVSVVIMRSQVNEARAQAKLAGGFLLDFHPGTVFTAMLLVGVACLLGSVVFISMDLWQKR